MKRYRVTSFDFDTRATILAKEVREDWAEEVRTMWATNKRKIRAGLVTQFGSEAAEEKIADLVAVGPKPISVVAFHNEFLDQIRDSFVVGAYYPSLTGACALGERILNHLLLRLREHFRGSPEYKRIHRKQSFDDWSRAVETLDSWSVLLPEVGALFGRLADIRHRALHFDPETDRNARGKALEAVEVLQNIIQRQFGAFGTHPWFIDGVRGAAFIRQSWESDPFVSEIFLPNCTLVGPYHSLERSDDGRWIANDESDEGLGDLTDDEFRDLYNDK